MVASLEPFFLLLPTDEFVAKPMLSPGGSSTSSRDASPSRDVSPLAKSLNPPIIIRKGARGFGFTLKTIRVYQGESDNYNLQHVVVVSCHWVVNHSSVSWNDYQYAKFLQTIKALYFSSIEIVLLALRSCNE